MFDKKSKSKGYTYLNSRGVEYHLNSKEATLNGGGKYAIYFFSKDHRAETACELPEDRTVAETSNGLPVVKKLVKADKK